MGNKNVTVPNIIFLPLFLNVPHNQYWKTWIDQKIGQKQNKAYFFKPSF